MSAEYVTKLIRRAVDANTAENAPASSRALSKFFGDPKLAEIAYAQVIERAESASSRKNTTQILLKCIRLLKQHLPRHHPSDETLLLLDRFAHRMQIQFPETFQSLEYIRALLEAISKTRHATKKKEKDAKAGKTKGVVVTGVNGNGASAAGGVVGGTGSGGNSAAAAEKAPGVGSAGGGNNTIATTDKRNSGAGGATAGVGGATGAGASGAGGSSPSGTLDGVPGSMVRFKTGGTQPAPGSTSKKRASKPRTSRWSAARASGEARRGPLVPNLLLVRSRARLMGQASSAHSSSSHAKSLVNVAVQHSQSHLHTGTLGGGHAGTGPLSLADSIRRDLESSLQSAPLFGGQFENLRLDAREILTVHDGELVQERILTVGMSKKNEERAMYRSLRRAAPLFQYKHYKDQSRLQLAQKQLDEIINAMLNPQSDNRLVASKIFIKLILDAYCQDGASVATAALTSLVMEMLESPHLEVQCHSFNLVFNLSVHVNMFEETPYFDPLHPMGSTPMITLIQQEMLSVVKEMLKLLVVRGETERRLWFSAMNALLYFTTEKGQIDRVRLIGIDYRTFVGFFKYIDYISDAVWRHLVRMLLNKLYMEGTIDMTAFTSNALSIDFLVQLYKDSRSLEARDNLFVTIYDYIGECYVRRVRAEHDDSDSEAEASSDEELATNNANTTPAGTSSSSRAQRERAITTQLSLCLEMLRIIDAPQFFIQVFKVPSFDFCSATVAFIRHRATSNAVLQDIWNTVDQSPSGIFQHIVLGDFYKLAVHCSQVGETVSQKISKLQTLLSTTSGSSSDGPPLKSFELDTLNKLLHSADHEDNEQGQKWLFQLKKSLLDVAITMKPTTSNAARSTQPASGSAPTGSLSGSGGVPSHRLATSAVSGGHSSATASAPTTQHSHHSSAGAISDISHDTRDNASGLVSPRGSSAHPSLVVESGPLASLSHEVESVFVALARSSNAAARRIYIQVVDNLLIHLRSKSSPGLEQRLTNAMVDLLNDTMSKLVDLGERSEVVLMLMFDTLIGFLGILPSSATRYRTGGIGGASGNGNGSGGLVFGGSGGSGGSDDMELRSSSGQAGNSSPNSSRSGSANSLAGSPPASQARIDSFALPQLDDSPAGLFLLGKITVPLRLLRRIKIQIIYHIFVNLPPRYTCQMRPALLYLLVERCKDAKEDADAVGGTAFFKKLLTENDPQISFLASRYLIDTLQKEKPDHFVDIVNTLLARAVEAYDERLVSNPYLQIKAILEMQDTVSPAKLGPISGQPPSSTLPATTSGLSSSFTSLAGSGLIPSGSGSNQVAEKAVPGSTTTGVSGGGSGGLSGSGLAGSSNASSSTSTANAPTLDKK